jgi:hypothetical protein
MKSLRLLLPACLLALATLFAGCARTPAPEEQIAHIMLQRAMIYATEDRGGMLPPNLAATKPAPGERIPDGHSLAEAIYLANTGLKLRTIDPGYMQVVVCPAKDGAYHGFLDGRVVFVPSSKH